jgi:radical SAM protein with 4Fe4S-binding SPASM domain
MQTFRYIPKFCVWELTLQCNMNCLHCGSRAGQRREQELSLAEGLDVADQLLALGCRQVTLIGGEVFLYKGWEEIARRLNDGGCMVNINTNGLLMGGREIAQIKHAGLVNIGLSVDGMEEHHDRARNRKGSFRKILRAFRQLREHNIPYVVVTTLMDFNFGDLEALYQLLTDERVETWQIQIAHPMGNMGDVPQHLIDPQKIPEITRFIREKRELFEMRVLAGDNIGYYDHNDRFIRGLPGEIVYWQGCGAGINGIGIDSIGNVKGCQSMQSDHFIEGNVRQQTLRTIWENEENFAYNRHFDVSMLTGNCAGCDKGEVCRGGCRASCFFSKGHKHENAYCHYNQTC